MRIFPVSLVSRMNFFQFGASCSFPEARKSAGRVRPAFAASDLLDALTELVSEAQRVKLPPRLLAHLRRWHRLGLSRKAVIEWNGVPVNSVRKGFAAVVKAAGLSVDVTPHILRHTCATWLMQKGVDLWDAAGFLGMTVQQLESTYGHHHPDFQHEAAEALGGQNGERNTVNKRRRTATNVTKIAAFSKLE
jgi:integrase